MDSDFEEDASDSKEEDFNESSSDNDESYNEEDDEKEENVVEPSKKKPKRNSSIPAPRDEDFDGKNMIELFNRANYDDIVFKWRSKHLKKIILDYVRFMVYKAAFPDIESNPGQYDNLLKNYKTFNQEVNGLCQFLITHLDFPDTVINATRRHSQRIGHHRYSNFPCGVCQNRPTYNIKFTGPNYNKNDLKIEKTTFPPQLTYFCSFHTYMADTFFTLVHMKWNIHLNIDYRIKSRNFTVCRNSNLIVDLGEELITNIAAYYFHVIYRLKSLNPKLQCHLVLVNALRSVETRTQSQNIVMKKK